MGRHTEYTEKMGKEICETVSNSHLMLEKLCEMHDHWPAAATVYKWRLDIPAFAEMYVHAKRAQIDPLVNRIFEITRDESGDLYDTGMGNGVNTARVARMKIEVDAIKWLSGKLCPRLYGEKKPTDDESALIDLPELKKAKSYEEKIQCIMNAVVDKKITPSQGNELSNIVEKMCRTYETSEAKPIIEKLKNKVK